MEFTIDITKLREQRRPLWMSPLGITSYAEFLGDGGDIYTDRLANEWARHSGEELLEDNPVEAAGVEGEFSEGVDFPPKSELTSTVEEAFMYVHKSD